MIESFSHNKIEDKIDRYVNGKLSQEEIDELWAELIQDGYHLEYLKTVANLKEAVQKRKEKQKSRQMRKYWSYAAAAVLALTIGVLSVFNLSQPASELAVSPIESIELDYVRSSAEGPMDNETDRIIRDAITLANSGKFDQATALLNNELQKAENPQWVSELNLNLGSLHYNEGNYKQSVNFFTEVVERESSIDVLTVEKAYWYLGNAYFQLDELDQAKQNIQKAHALNGAYSRVAQSYLNAFSR